MSPQIDQYPASFPSNQLLHVQKMWIFEQIVFIIHIGSKHGFDVLNGKNNQKALIDYLHKCLMTSLHILHVLPHSLKLEVLKMQNRKISANQNYFGTKIFLMF